MTLNTEDMRVYMQDRRDSGIVDVQAMNLWSHHRMTVRELEYRHMMQLGKCANPNCGIEIPLWGRDRAVDHDHSCCSSSTKTCGLCTRGLLCGACNKALGLAQDSMLVLSGLIEYLRIHTS